MQPVIRPGPFVLVTAALALVVNAASLVLRLTLLPARQAAASAGLPVIDEPFRHAELLLSKVNTDEEANAAVWLSSAVLLLIGVTALGLWMQERRSRSVWRWHWLALALVSCYVSLDEVSVLHELAIPVMVQVVEARGVLTFAWVVLAAPIVVLLAVSFLPFLHRLPYRTGLLLAAAATLFVGGALGLELLGGWIADGNGGVLSTQYVWTTAVEELLENLGSLLALFAVLRHSALTARSSTSTSTSTSTSQEAAGQEAVSQEAAS